MDKLDRTERAKITKMSSDRYKAVLIGAGRKADQIGQLDRVYLLEAMAELVLSEKLDNTSDDTTDATAVAASVGGGEVDIRWAELELGQSQLRFQEKQLKEQREQLEMQLKLEELKLRSADKAHNEDFILRRETFEYNREKDMSLVSLTKRYGDATKWALMKMPTEVGELTSYFENCERVFKSYEVPDILQTKLLIPQLTQKAKSLLNRISADDMNSYPKVREFLLSQFCLTSREYRAKFVNATKESDETHVAFVTRLKNYLTYYWRSRGCEGKSSDYLKVFDLCVADRIKDQLSMPTLKYLLSQEGNDTFTAEKLGTLADMYEPNFYPDGRYKALTVTTEGPRQSKQAYKLGNQTKTFESSRKEDSLPTQAYEPKQGSRGG